MTDQPTPIQDLSQKRAYRAWQAISAVSHTDKQYEALTQGLSQMVQNNGMLTALAFMKAKNKPHHQRLYQQLSEWVGEQVYNDSTLICSKN